MLIATCMVSGRRYSSEQLVLARWHSRHGMPRVPSREQVGAEMHALGLRDAMLKQFPHSARAAAATAALELDLEAKQLIHVKESMHTQLGAGMALLTQFFTAVW